MVCRDGFEIADIGVAGDQSPVGFDRALIGFDDDLAALAVNLQRFGLFVDCSACG